MDPSKLCIVSASGGLGVAIGCLPVAFLVASVGFCVASFSAPAEYGEKQLVQHEGQQTLQVRVLEDEVPVRNIQALKEAAVTAVLKAAAEAPIRVLPAPDGEEIA